MRNWGNIWKVSFLFFRWSYNLFIVIVIIVVIIILFMTIPYLIIFRLFRNHFLVFSIIIRVKTHKSLLIVGMWFKFTSKLFLLFKRELMHIFRSLFDSRISSTIVWEPSQTSREEFRMIESTLINLELFDLIIFLFKVFGVASIKFIKIKPKW